MAAVDLAYIENYYFSILAIINWYIVPVLFAVAFLYFLWRVYDSFFLGADDEKKRESGRQFVLWGVIAFVVIISVWGLVALVANTFGLMLGEAAPPAPQL